MRPVSAIGARCGASAKLQSGGRGRPRSRPVQYGSAS